MDRLISLTSNSSEISQDYFPPIELDSKHTYALGLYTLNTYNSIPNIIEGVNNKFHFTLSDQNGKTREEVISLEEGCYEIEAIQGYLREKLVNFTENEITFVGEEEKPFKISIKPNSNTLNIEIFCVFTIHFDRQGSIGKVLGFSERKLEKNILHVSDSVIQISAVSEINVECNIVEGSFRNGKPCHTIFTFYPDVEPGYKLSLQPTNVIYLPVNTRTINNITLRLVDQEGRLVNFRKEEISIQLNLRRLWG